MSENFYEVLGASVDAPPEDIRRAYRKRALQTHPDRLPQGATPEDKRAAEEEFRKVNNAYEILIDSKNRKLYDLYGVWPPPEKFPDEPRQERDYDFGRRHSHRHFPVDPFDELFNSPSQPPFPDQFTRRHRSRPAPVFRDPFEIFNAMFADMQHDLYYGSSPLFSRPPDPFWGRAGPMLGRSPAELPSSLFHPMPVFRPFVDFPAFPNERPHGSSEQRPHRNVFSFESASHELYGPDSGSDNPQWVSEKRMTRTVNGVTQSIWKGRDRNGNEHVTYTYPDGREQYTINGVEQSHSTHHIQDATSAGHRYAPPTPVIPPEQVEAPSKRRWWSRH